MKQGNLLIIDDEIQLLESLGAFLEDVASRIIAVENGSKALEILKHEKVDCIVCDIKMPGMDGLQVIKNVRSMGIETPFIFFTAYGSEETMLEAVKYGAFDFVNKPKLEALVEIVSNGLQAGIKLNQNRPESLDDVMDECQELLGDTDKKK